MLRSRIIDLTSKALRISRGRILKFSKAVYIVFVEKGDLLVQTFASVVFQA